MEATLLDTSQIVVMMILTIKRTIVCGNAFHYHHSRFVELLYTHCLMR